MTLFATVNWAATLLTFAALVVAIARTRWLLVKPSIWVLLAHHVVLQWTTTLESDRVFTFLPNPWVFALVMHGFAIIGLSGSLLIGRASAWEVWRRVTATSLGGGTDRPGGSNAGRFIVVLGLITVLIVAYYLRTVPFEQSGLHAILYDPANAEQAREESLKLLTNPVARYGFSFVISVFAPLLVGLLVGWAWDRGGRGKLLAFGEAIAGIGVLVAIVSLTGARSYAATLLLTAGVAAAIRTRFDARLLALVPLGILALAVPTILTIYREGVALDLRTFLPYLRAFLLERVLFGPADTGLWYVHWEQTRGLVGVAGVPKLAALLHVPAVDMPNTIGLLYTDYGLDTIHANTGYLFAYFAYFGPLALPACLVLLWLTDSALWVYLRLESGILPATLAAVSVAAIGFIVAEYTTVLLTHGFALLLLVSWLLARGTQRPPSTWLVPAPQSAT